MSDKIDKMEVVGEINSLLGNQLSIGEELELMILPGKILVHIKELIKKKTK